MKEQVFNIRGAWFTGWQFKDCCMVDDIDPNTKKEEDGYSVLHVACNNSSDEDITELVKYILERYVAILSQFKFSLTAA